MRGSISSPYLVPALILVVVSLLGILWWTLNHPEEKISHDNEIALSHRNTAQSQRVGEKGRILNNTKSGEEALLRAEPRGSAKMILDGASILEFLPNNLDLKAMLFFEELQNALRADLLASGDFGKIVKIFEELEGSSENLTGAKIRLLKFTTNLESGSGISNDVSEKIRLFEILNRSDHIMRFSRYLTAVGAEKALGPIDEDVMSAIPIVDRKPLLKGMTRSGDLDAITTVLGIKEKAERDPLLRYTIMELMESHPGKSITYIDEMQNLMQRKFCLKVAVESLHKAGAVTEAEEWAEQLLGESNPD
jgi:hypothetical protein